MFLKKKQAAFLLSEVSSWEEADEFSAEEATHVYLKNGVSYVISVSFEAFETSMTQYLSDVKIKGLK